MMVGLLAGCAPSAQEPNPATTAPGSAAPGPAAPSSSAKDTIVYGYNGDLGNLDPSMRNTNGSILATITMFDTLLDPYSENYAPKLADHYEVNDAGTEVTFYLRDDVTFHDGTKLSANDVKYSIENNMTSPLHAVYADGVKEITVVDDLTVKVIMEEPSGLLLYNLAHIYIIPADLHAAMTSEKFAEHPIGCGPYKFVSKDVSGEIVMEAYEDYFLGAAPVKTLKGYSYSDDYSRAIALENGEIDIGRVNDAAIESLKANAKTKVMPGLNEMVQFVVLNTTVAPLDNPKVREAIAYAIDRDMIVKARYPNSGFVNSILCAPTMEGYSTDVSTYTYDPEKAKALMQEAGVSTPIDLGSLEIMARDVSDAEIVQSNLAAIGINVAIRQSDVGAFFDIGGNGSMVIGIFGGAWGGSFGHMNEIIGSSNIGEGMNWSSYSNTEVDRLMQQATATADQNGRAALFTQALALVQTDLPMVNLYSYDYTFGAAADLDAVVHINGEMAFYEMSWAN